MQHPGSAAPRLRTPLAHRAPGPATADDRATSAQIELPRTAQPEAGRAEFTAGRGRYQAGLAGEAAKRELTLAEPDEKKHSPDRLRGRSQPIRTRDPSDAPGAARRQPDQATAAQRFAGQARQARRPPGKEPR
jgi:hypothetical protein